MSTVISGHIPGSFNDVSKVGGIQDLDASSSSSDESSVWSCNNEASRHQEICSHCHHYCNHPSRTEHCSAKQQVHAAVRCQKCEHSKVTNTVGQAFAQAIAELAQAYNLPPKLKNPTEARRHKHKEGWIGAEIVE
jgi:hypothetical protein